MCMIGMRESKGFVRLVCALFVGLFSQVVSAVELEDPVALGLDADALVEVMSLAMEALAISQRAADREAQHKVELAKQGVAEVPPSSVAKYVMNVGKVGKFVFNTFGELYVDRRFVTKDEMVTIRKIEAWFRNHFPDSAEAFDIRTKDKAGAPRKVPVFRGFEDGRYQSHDELIVRLTAEFNANKAAWCGGTDAQAKKIADITPAVVKSHMIEESGGNGVRSLAAWVTDPLQVNVPGDWGAEKSLLGLKKPAKRNEGELADNVRAAIMYLSRKGFGVSGRPAKDRPKGFFDGWNDALRRYNGRRDRTDTDRYYSDEYADKILRRAADPNLFVPIEIKTAASK